MTAHTIAEAFADAAARLTSGVDQSGDLVALLADCTALLGAESAGLLVDVPGEGLALLSSTSHATDVLELYELQNGLGPCIEAVQDNKEVWADEDELTNGWPPVGRAIAGAGYSAVHAFPLRWHDQAVGALNIFLGHEGELDQDQRRLGQAFANMAVAVLAGPAPAGGTTSTSESSSCSVSASPSSRPRVSWRYRTTSASPTPTRCSSPPPTNRNSRWPRWLRACSPARDPPHRRSLTGPGRLTAVDWVHVIIDIPPEHASTSTRFWAAVLGWPVGETWSGQPSFPQLRAARGGSVRAPAGR